MISIIDYGLGNVLAFRNVYEQLNVPVSVARSPADLAKSTKLILPGVGAFDRAMERFEASGMRGPVEELVFQQNVPVLGICVGMQMLAASSEEGKRAGLGWVDGTVRKFRDHPLALPHMGWNDVKPAPAARLFLGLENGARFYFLHSYYFVCLDPKDVLAVSDYGGGFSCAVNRGNIFGVQFHPEKSHQCGGQLLRNFATL
jgi:imidazole glycerol-phosphate synthase subunit HisH